MLIKYSKICAIISTRQLDIRRYAIISFIVLITFFAFRSRNFWDSEDVLDLNRIKQRVLEKDAELPRSRNSNCSYWDCFNVYRCGHKDISIYIYPIYKVSF